MYVGIVTICIAQLSSFELGVAQNSNVTIEDIAKGVSDLESHIQTFSVTMNIDYSSRSFFPPHIVSQPLTSTVVCSFNKTDKFIYDIQSPIIRADGSLTATVFRKGCYNGTIYKEFFGETNAVRGIIRSTPGSIPWGFDPKSIFFTYAGSDLAETLGKNGGHIVNYVNNKNVIIIESAGVTDKEGMIRKIRLHVSLDYGFSIVTREALRYVKHRKVWLPYATTEFSEYKKNGQIWVPHKAVDTTLLINNVEEKDSLVLSKAEVIFSNYSINHAVDLKAYDFSFPNNTQVTDERTGAVFTAVNADQNTLNDTIKNGRNFLNRENRNKQIRRIVIGTSLFGVFLMLLIIYYYRRRSKLIAIMKPEQDITT